MNDQLSGNLHPSPGSSLHKDSSRDSPNVRRGKWVVAALLLAVAVIVAYFNILPGAFIHDDISEIVENPYIKDPAFIGRIFTSPAWSFEFSEERTGVSNYYRPLQYLTYLAIYQVWGPNPLGFRLFKLLLHLLTVQLVSLFCRRLISSTRAAFLAALLFALHPVNTEAVTWISGITDALCVPFVLLSLLFYLAASPGRGEERGRLRAFPYLLSLLFFFLGLYAKETAAIVLVLIVLLDLLRLPPGRVRPSWFRYLPYLFLFIIYLVCRVAAIGSFQVPGSKYVWLTRLQCLVNPVYLAGAYFFKSLLPINQNGWYVFHPVLNLADPRLIAAAVLLAALVVLAWRLARVGRKIELFFLLWFFITLLPVLLFFRQIGLNVFTERYLYLPGVGFCALVALTLNRLPRRWVWTVTLVIAAVYLVLTVRRNTVWRDRYSFWTATAAASPDSSIARNNLGVQYYLRGEYDRAEDEYREAARLMADNPTPRSNLALAYSRRGLYHQALAECEAALIARPDSADAYETMGDILLKMEKPAGALAAYQIARDIHPARAEILVRIGRAQLAGEDYAAAEETLGEALRRDPGSAAARVALGALWEKQGDSGRAEEAFAEALRLEPSNARALIGLAAFRDREGRYPEALELLRRARAGDPDLAEIPFRMAVIFSRQQRFSEAVDEYREALRLDPVHAPAYIGLGVLLGMAGKYEASESLLLKAVELDPGSADGYFNLAVLYRKLGREEEFRRQADRLAEISPESARDLLERDNYSGR